MPRVEALYARDREGEKPSVCLSGGVSGIRASPGSPDPRIIKVGNPQKAAILVGEIYIIKLFPNYVDLASKKRILWIGNPRKKRTSLFETRAERGSKSNC